MARNVLPEEEVVSEIDRLLGPEVLGWWKTREGIEWHTLDKNTSHRYGIYAAMLAHLLDEAIREGMRPAYIIGYLALQMRTSTPTSREELKEIIPDWDALDRVYLDDDMERRVKEKNENI